MKKLEIERGKHLWVAGLAATAVAVTAFSCGGNVTKPNSGGESHFLDECESRCGAELDCIGAVCTRSCVVGRDSCADLDPAALCTDQSVEPGAVAVCDVACTASTECASLGDEHTCEGDYCRGPLIDPAGSAGAGGTSGSAGSGAGPSGNGGTGMSGPTDSGLTVRPPLSDCVSEIPAENRPAEVIVTSLEELCAALEPLGVTCPEGRTPFVADVAANCLEGGRFPTLRRWCDADEVMFSTDGFSVSFTFDVATGELEGVWVFDLEGQLPCGRDGYVGGEVRPWYTCQSSSYSCQLCTDGETGWGPCPPDVSAVIPTTPCAAWTPPACTPSEVGFEDLPVTGTSCGGPDDCDHLSNGTCWSDCECMHDGNYRWLTQCTE